MAAAVPKYLSSEPWQLEANRCFHPLQSTSTSASSFSQTHKIRVCSTVFIENEQETIQICIPCAPMISNLRLATPFHKHSKSAQLHHKHSHSKPFSSKLPPVRLLHGIDGAHAPITLQTLAIFGVEVLPRSLRGAWLRQFKASPKNRCQLESCLPTKKTHESNPSGTNGSTGFGDVARLNPNLLDLKLGSWIISN